MSEKTNYRCPYCEHGATLIEGVSYFDREWLFTEASTLGPIQFRQRVYVCPNDDCRSVSTVMTLHRVLLGKERMVVQGEPFERWSLLPRSKARTFPGYVPEPIRKDYDEACEILELSPKASATLSRRCLQGMIRDFWKVTGCRNLFEEIAAIKDELDEDAWAAIDAVRKIGNIGAHMKQDINYVVDVDPNEAAALVELIETLIDDWYVRRHVRQQRMAKVRGIAEAKDGSPDGIRADG